MEERHHKKGSAASTGRLTQKDIAARMESDHEPELKISRPEGCEVLEERLMRQLDTTIKRDITRALELMYRAHSGQKRDEGTPYATHPLEVALIAVEECKMRGRDEVVAALLHDVLEDHPPTTPKDIEEKFGPLVAEAVVTLTKMYKRDGTPKELGLRRYYEGLRGAPSWVRAVKICDRVHNLRSLPKSGRGVDHIAQYKKATRENLLPLCTTSTDVRLLKAAELLLQELHRK
jgi:(p)ppGpp synthase/HD superfamily hydrolase